MNLRPIILIALASACVADEPKLLVNETLDHIPPKPWLTPHGMWKAADGAIWGAEKKEENHGASVRGFVEFGDAKFHYEFMFKGGVRHTLGLNQKNDHLFHIDFLRDRIIIVKNAMKNLGEGKNETLLVQKVTLPENEWMPVTVAIQGDKVRVEIAGAQHEAKHKALALPKGGFNLYVQGDAIGFRKLTVAEISK